MGRRVLSVTQHHFAALHPVYRRGPDKIPLVDADKRLPQFRRHGIQLAVKGVLPPRRDALHLPPVGDEV